MAPVGTIAVLELQKVCCQASEPPACFHMDSGQVPHGHGVLGQAKNKLKRKYLKKKFF